MYAQSLKVTVEVAENGDVTIQLPRLVKPHRVSVIDDTGKTIVQAEVQEIPAAPQPATDPAPASEDEALAAWRKKREEYRQKLLAAGRLVTEFPEIPEDARRLTVEERMRLGTLPPGARSSLDLINEDRDERF